MDYVPENTQAAVYQEAQYVNEFTKQADVAQYKGSHYANAVRVERGISLKDAFEIAKSDPSIDYFVRMKGGMMVLEIPPEAGFDPDHDPLGLVTDTSFRYDNGQPGKGHCRIFQKGDVVFFKKDGMWLGSAPGLADAYFKN